MLHPEGDAISLLLLDISDDSFHLFRNAKRSTRDRILVNRRKVCRGAYLYEVGKEQDVGGGRPHVSPWGIPRLPHIIDIPCCCSSAALSSTPPRSRWILHCPLVTPFLCILRSLSFSHHSHRILSISIIGTLHSADPSGPRTNTEYPLACVLRVEGRSFFLFAEH